MAANSIYCPICRKNRIKSSFLKSINPAYNGLIPFCKNCYIELYNNNLKQLKKDGAAMWYTCSQIGYPFLNEVWGIAKERAVEDKLKTVLPVYYILSMNELKEEVSGFWETDVDVSEFLDRIDDSKAGLDRPDLIRMQTIWGKFEPEDYIYLDKTFKDYVGDEKMDANMTNRYRDLCKAELRLRKANENGGINEVKSAQDVLNKQLALLGLNNFTKEFESEEQRAYEKKIAMIEHFKPAECEDLKKYIDMVGYEKAKAVPMRAIRNAITGSREYPDIAKEK